MNAGTIEADLRQALVGPVSEFVLHYQPVIDLASGEVVGVESLIRWQHPVLGLLAPGHFIHLAEDNGLMLRLGDWALDQAARDASRLTHRGRALDVAVNFSVVQIDDQAVFKLRRVLEAHDLEPGRLTVEVTESAFVTDEGVTATIYAGLSRLGVKFAVDDFGTSLSSLLHLRRYPIHALKIDRQVVAGLGARPNDEAICDSIISLACAVNASTVAEGVETAEQYAVLRAMGCVRGQGFLWSPAVPIGQLDTAFRRCEAVAVPPPGSRLPRVPEGVTAEISSTIARMHAEGASTQAIADELNRTVGRHPSGVRWSAGAVARGLPTTGVTRQVGSTG